MEDLNEIHKLISSDIHQMREHSAVSDLLGALSKNSIKGVAGHRDGYFDSHVKIAQEAFAHMYEAQFDKIRYMEMQKYFPEALKYFERRLEEIGK